MAAPTVSDTIRVSAQTLGMDLTADQLGEAEAWVAQIRRQAEESGTPSFEADLMAQGFVLGCLWSRRTSGSS